MWYQYTQVSLQGTCLVDGKCPLYLSRADVVLSGYAKLSASSCVANPLYTARGYPFTCASHSALWVEGGKRCRASFLPHCCAYFGCKLTRSCRLPRSYLSSQRRRTSSSSPWWQYTNPPNVSTYVLNLASHTLPLSAKGVACQTTCIRNYDGHVPYEHLL